LALIESTMGRTSDDAVADFGPTPTLRTEAIEGAPVLQVACIGQYPRTGNRVAATIAALLG